jgi:lipopolysaccharide/colanic/teichoic acid biosynthesis glycosyltransferase
MAKYIEKNGMKIKKVGLGYGFFKRAFDLFASFLALLLIGWFLLIIGIIVAISLKGNPIYADKRIGRNGKIVNVLKFRSMYKDANEHPERYLNEQQMEQFQKERKVDNDPRIAPIGKFTRKTSIDELPQLLNIFIGNMSLVGPRPITEVELTTHFSKEQQEILLSAKPGLTGHWQVSGRSDLDFQSGERQRLELQYFEIRGLGTDLKILFKTIPAVLKHKGAK